VGKEGKIALKEKGERTELSYSSTPEGVSRNGGSSLNHERAQRGRVSPTKKRKTYSLKSLSDGREAYFIEETNVGGERRNPRTTQREKKIGNLGIKGVLLVTAYQKKTFDHFGRPQ